MGRLVKRDLSKVKDGVWVPFEPGSADSIEFKIAALNNPAHREAMVRARRRTDPAVMRQIAAGGMSTEAERELNATLAGTVLLDWRNMEDDAGQPVPFSVEKAREILTDPAYQEVTDFVREVAGNERFYRESAAASVEGNSETLSGGNSSTGS